MLVQNTNDSILKNISEKILNNIRLDVSEGEYLYSNVNISQLGILANYIREKKHGHKTFFNRNFHLEPTNVCLYT